jgi:pyruvate-formate lyase-activating enzyme
MITTGMLPIRRESPDATAQPWHACRFLTCSVLPVRMACNLRCPFCFSKSSISSLKFEAANWEDMDVENYYGFSRDRGATRLVITGGGEPLLRPSDCVSLIRRGRKFFDEVALFTNGSRLTGALSRQLADAGLSYFCYSRHHHADDRCRQLMGDGAPSLAAFVEAAAGIKIRATCVMTRGWIDSQNAVDQYISALSAYGICEFTFKHTYVAYERSVFADSPANAWSRAHQIQRDPFAGRGEIVARLPWGPRIRKLDSHQVCYYFEPTPDWELENRLCRSVNLLSDGTVYASLENQQSRLFRLGDS